MRIFSLARCCHILYTPIRCISRSSQFSKELNPLNESYSRIGNFREDQVPISSDIVIVGGGLVGWSVAFWLRWTTKLTVTLIERDPTYSRSASVLGLGSIRQQFSEPENIQMSLFTSYFLRNIRQFLSVTDDPIIDIEFNPQGCLLLSTEEQKNSFKRNFDLQQGLGSKLELLDRFALKERWPWLNVDDIHLGCYGYENEGWFDPWLLLKALRAKSHVLGVNYVVGEVVDFEPAEAMARVSFIDMPKRMPVIGRPLRKATVVLPDQSCRSITFSSVVNAAGPWAADVAKLAEIGTTHLNVPLPVEPRFRPVFLVRPTEQLPPSDDIGSPSSSHPLTPGLDTPFLIGPDRLCVERRGLSGEFFVYSEDPKWDSFSDELMQDSDSSLDATQARAKLFDQELRPQLSNRIPSLGTAELVSSWTIISDYNYVDQNLIIGHHPFHVNMYFCSGSSGHGAQHAIAIGRAVSELIVSGHYRTIDLTRFSFDRLHLNELINETNAF